MNSPEWVLRFKQSCSMVAPTLACSSPSVSTAPPCSICTATRRHVAGSRGARVRPAVARPLRKLGDAIDRLRADALGLSGDADDLERCGASSSPNWRRRLEGCWPTPVPAPRRIPAARRPFDVVAAGCSTGAAVEPLAELSQQSGHPHRLRALNSISIGGGPRHEVLRPIGRRVPVVPEVGGGGPPPREGGGKEGRRGVPTRPASSSSPGPSVAGRRRPPRASLPTTERRRRGRPTPGGTRLDIGIATDDTPLVLGDDPRLAALRRGRGRSCRRCGRRG